MLLTWPCYKKLAFVKDSVLVWVNDKCSKREARASSTEGARVCRRRNASAEQRWHFTNLWLAMLRTWLPGAYPDGRTPWEVDGLASESLILVAWNSFFPWSIFLRPSRNVDLPFYFFVLPPSFLFVFFNFFILSFPFLFLLFWHPFSYPGVGSRPLKPPKTCPWLTMWSNMVPTTWYGIPIWLTFRLGKCFARYHNLDWRGRMFYTVPTFKSWK